MDNILDGDSKHPGTVCQYLEDQKHSCLTGVGIDDDYSLSLRCMRLKNVAGYESHSAIVEEKFYLFAPTLLNAELPSRMIWMEAPA